MDFSKLIPEKKFYFYLRGGREFMVFKGRNITDAIKAFVTDGHWKLKDLERIEKEGPKWPAERASQVLLSGSWVGWAKKQDEANEQAVRRDIRWEIVRHPAEEHEGRHYGAREWLRLASGGVTGYESFGLWNESDEYNTHSLRTREGEKFWCACAGNHIYKELRISIGQVKAALEQYMDLKGIQVVDGEVRETNNEPQSNAQGESSAR